MVNMEGGVGRSGGLWNKSVSCRACSFPLVAHGKFKRGRRLVSSAPKMPVRPASHALHPPGGGLFAYTGETSRSPLSRGGGGAGGAGPAYE